MFDVIIAGGGPTGSMPAAELHLHDLPVLVLERAVTAELAGGERAPCAEPVDRALTPTRPSGAPVAADVLTLFPPADRSWLPLPVADPATPQRHRVGARHAAAQGHRARTDRRVRIRSAKLLGSPTTVPRLMDRCRLSAALRPRN